MNFGTESRSSSLIIKMIFEIAELTRNCTWAVWSENFNVPDFYETWHSERTEHARYEQINWN